MKYDSEQVRAWAPDVPNPMEWEKRMRSHETFVAERDGEPVAFIELEQDGHLRMLYRVPGVAGEGVAAELYRVMEERAHELGIRRIHTEASLLAESFLLRADINLISERRSSAMEYLFRVPGCSKFCGDDMRLPPRAASSQTLQESSRDNMLTCLGCDHLPISFQGAGERL